MNPHSLPTIVHCRMAGCEIPAELCDTEQNGRDCSGCTAPTRRCVRCKDVTSLADASLGLCASCLKKQGGEAPVRVEFADLASAHAYADRLLKKTDKMKIDRVMPILAAIDQFLPGKPFMQKVLRLRLGADGQPRMDRDEVAKLLGITSKDVYYKQRQALELMKTNGANALVIESVAIALRYHAKPRSRKNGKSSSLVPDTPRRIWEDEELFSLLLEHTKMFPNGDIVVRSPARVLCIRAEFSEEEADAAVARIVAEKNLTMPSPDALLLPGIYTEQIAASEKIDRRFRPRLVKSQQVSSDTPTSSEESLAAAEAPTTVDDEIEIAEPEIPEPVFVPPPPPEKPVKQLEAPSFAAYLPKKKNGFDVLALLKANGRIVDGKLVVRGAVPFLQIQCNIGPRSAIALLEPLRDAGDLQQLDGWRVIAIGKKSPEVARHPDTSEVVHASFDVSPWILEVADGGCETLVFESPSGVAVSVDATPRLAAPIEDSSTIDDTAIEAFAIDAESPSNIDEMTPVTREAHVELQAERDALAFQVQQLEHELACVDADWRAQAAEARLKAEMASGLQSGREAVGRFFSLLLQPKG